MIETILITGANRGIGLALTKLAITNKLRVEACCRDLENSIELKKLSNKYTDLNIIEMDVTSSQSIIKVSKQLKNPIDILVCNEEEAKYVANYITNGGSSEELMEKFKDAVSEGFNPEVHLKKVGLANQTTMYKRETKEIGRILSFTAGA